MIIAMDEGLKRFEGLELRDARRRQLQISGFPDCVNFMMALGGGEAGPGGHDRHNGPGAVV
jgi:hypothetical protein